MTYITHSIQPSCQCDFTQMSLESMAETRLTHQGTLIIFISILVTESSNGQRRKKSLGLESSI